jgi:DNA helicase II / ATP-dependent DNA helicase PcrA
MTSFNEHYDRLNQEQKRAVDLTDGPLLVLAGPGTGKTQLLSVRASNIILSRKALPEQILILTFTNAAVGAMRERLSQIIGNDGYDVEVETFHSFANSIVLESEEALKYVKDKIELNDIEKVRAIQYILDNVKEAMELRPFGSPYIHRAEITKRISELKNEGLSPETFGREVSALKPNGDVLEEKTIKRLRALSAIYAQYERLKNKDAALIFDERGRLDYDDMILIATDALKNEKELRNIFRKKYRYIMVDEYQDTNSAQLELLFSILDPAAPNLCCVGDDDQAIYRFQGATLSNFRVLKERFPALKTVSLKDNYRSTGQITDLSVKIIGQLPEDERIVVKKLNSRRDYDQRDIRFFQFLTEEEELAFIVDRILEQADLIKKDTKLSPEERERPFNNIAVLVRKRSYILKVVDAFLKSGIPYATDGEEDIRPEKRVRQMLDVAELAAADAESIETKSLSLYRILTSDYMETELSDILKFIQFVNGKRQRAREKLPAEYASCNLFQQFLEHFGCFEKDSSGADVKPSKSDSQRLPITGEEGVSFKDPYSLHRAAWAIKRLMEEANSAPVHDLLMRYIEDTQLYNFILKRYEKDKVLKVRDLRVLVSFINKVKQSDLGDPAIGLSDFMKELELREVNGMPIQGQLATLSQDGVRVLTAHSAKGLEFYTVFVPFCLQQKSWPLRRKGDAVPIPPEIFTSREKIEEKEKKKLLDRYDELRLFYVASSRARSHLFYTATPAEKIIVSPFLNHLGIDPEDGSPASEEEFLVKFLERKPKDDSLKGTEDTLRDMLFKLTLNPTSLNNYINCPRKFLYDNVLMLPGRKKQQLVFGNCVHKALEEVFSAYMKTRKFPSFDTFRDIFDRELEFQGVSEPVKNACIAKFERLQDWYKAESESPVMPVELENKLEVILPGGIIFRGTFDKIEPGPGGNIKVVDYKTGKPDDHVKAIAKCRDLSSTECDDYFRQLVAYKLLYERYYRKEKKNKVVKGVLQFLEPVAADVKKYGLEKGSYRNEEVDLTDEMVGELKDVLEKCWKDIKDLRFDKLAARDGKKRCRYCEFDHMCWGA